MMEKNLGGEQTIAENKDVVKEKLLKERAVVEENNDEAKVGNTKESEEDDESFAWCDDQLRLDVVNLFLNQHISSNLLNTLQNIFLSNEKSTIDKQKLISSLNKKVGKSINIMIFKESEKVRLIPLKTKPKDENIIKPLQLKNMIKDGSVYKQFNIFMTSDVNQDFCEKHQGFDENIFKSLTENTDFFASLPVQLFNKSMSTPSETKKGDIENKIEPNHKKLFSKMQDQKRNGVKLMLPQWGERSDPHDWYATCEYLIKLNTNNYSDKEYIQILLSSIKDDQLRCKLVTELSRENESRAEVSLEIFKNIFEKL